VLAQVVFLTGPGKCEIRELDCPDPCPGQVQVRCIANGICMGEVCLFTGQEHSNYPRRLGHEARQVRHHGQSRQARQRLARLVARALFVGSSGVTKKLQVPRLVVWGLYSPPGLNTNSRKTFAMRLRESGILATIATRCCCSGERNSYC